MIAASVLFLGLASAVPQVTADRVTLSKKVDAFGRCFARSQDEAGRPWAFMPTASGGTFTNVGGRGAGTPYHLLVRASDGGTSVRLITGNPTPGLVQAVERCG